MGKSRGPRRKSRATLSKRVREKGRLGLSRLLVNYENGEKVVIRIDPAIHKGAPHKRYQGKVGEVMEKRGSAYLLRIPFSKKDKVIIATPEHLKRL